MHSKKLSHNVRHIKYWIIGFAALIWIVIRSGANPKRLTYPCQRAAMPLAAGWLLAVAGFLGGSIALRKFTRISGFAIVIAGIVWFVATLPEYSGAASNTISSPPYWEVPNPVSKIFVLDSIPPTSGSLTAGNATVPNAYLPDPAVDTLMMMLAANGVYLHKTAAHPNGIVGSDNIVVLKGNFQWTKRNATSTDRIKGVIWQILNHPDGFTGEIIVYDNTQGRNINVETANNSEDETQTLPDVVNTFRAKGYPVYCRDWSYILFTVASEYSTGDYNDGYVYDSTSKISYPKFHTPSGKHLVSLRYGIWDSTSTTYDASRLCIIDFPVLKAHSMSGATVSLKNWIGVLTIAYMNERYGGWGPMHEDYFFSPYALVARVMAVTFPRLCIVDAAWTTTAGPESATELVNTKMLLASTDPVAVDWYSSKFILTPIARLPHQTNPDLVGSQFHTILNNWATFLRDSTSFACTKDSTKISVYGRSSLFSPSAPPAPNLLDPAPGSINQSLNPTLRWNLATGATKYQIQISSDSTFSSLIIDTLIHTDTSLLVSNLLYSSKYYWHVKSKNDISESVWSLRGSFTTVHPLSMCVTSNWNIVSLPALLDDQSRQCLFPEAISKSFMYIPGDGYESCDTLDHGIGYWLKFDSVQTFSFKGMMITTDTLDLKSGWNLIGSVAKTMHVGMIQYDPQDMIHSNIFGYRGSYSVEDSLVPCKGYWIKVNTDGKLILSSSANNRNLKSNITSTNEKWNTLKFTSDDRKQTLYFGNEIEPSSVTAELPPVPPEGAFDVRFASNQMFAPLGKTKQVDYPITIRSTNYPISISWIVKENGVISVLKVDGREILLQGTGSIDIQKPLRGEEWGEYSRVVLSVPGSSTIPEHFSLEQNYPNPFNPTTSIRYQLPLDGKVTLRIYDMQGKIVRTLFDGVEDAGYKAVEWNSKDDAGKDVSSGIYFYRIEFRSPQGTGLPGYLVKKMVLMR